MPDDFLTTLDLAPADVPDLPAKTRTSLIAYLLRWEHYDEAHRCLQQLLVTHSQLVSIYDSLARLFLAQDRSDRALEMMRRRHALRASNSSRALEAQAHLAAGDVEAAQAIVDQLVREQPDMLLTWRLQAEFCLATGDLDGAESAWQRGEELRPGNATNAQGIARVWQARGDDEKALLWARTALAQTSRDERQPSVVLLRLLETLYRATGQQAQAESTADRLRLRHQRELEELRRALDPTLVGIEPKPTPQPTRPIVSPPLTAAERPADAAFSTPVLTGALDLTPDEHARLEQALHQDFGHEAFRPGQADVIAAILRGESALTVMPTGAGKSLCYQLAAMLLPGTTLVISPLIALMKDQVDGLPAGVAAQATTLNYTLPVIELRARLSHAARGKYRLLYAAPERLRQRPFLHALKRANVSLLVVDEAHCVSLWGHDFRPDYLFIAKAWQELGQPPILAMTATATPRVRDDIQAALGRMRLVTTDIHRPNLCLEARHFAKAADKKRVLLALCRQIEGSGIVYARSRRECEELAQMLQRNGISAIHYHAGITNRDAAQDRFMRDEARIVVATIAFGMGVDKADVRFIIHYSPPQALENYYQEAGRAGRDGLPANCILFYTSGDKATLTRLSRRDALHIEFLRKVYAALQRRLGADGVGLVTIGDLERDLLADETQLRVAIHFLETAGLLWRGFDLPRTATLNLSRPPDGEDADLARFVETARLRPGQTVTRNLLAVSQDAELDPRTIEAQVLAWNDAGWLDYRGIGRDMLLALPEPPRDSEQRVTAMLADYWAGKDGRIGEMMAYATTKSCRHGHISAYFGGRTIERCQACDNCLGQVASEPVPARRTRPASSRGVTVDLSQDQADDLKAVILQGVAQLPYPMGRTGLARALQGASSSTVQTDRFALFGALTGWTQKSIIEQAAQLEDQGLLASFDKGRYRLLHLTDEGEAWLGAHPRDPGSIAPPEPARRRSERRSETELPADCDEALFERLRAWRLEKAREIEKPPYVIFHDVVLRRIAASRPATPQELIAIKGIGPRKVEQYGPAVLGIIASYD
jgi:ATP-dependent DNA helicase RecQ